MTTRYTQELTAHSSTTPHNIYFHMFPKKKKKKNHCHHSHIYPLCPYDVRSAERENTELTTTNLEITQVLFFFSRSCRRGSVRIER